VLRKGERGGGRGGLGDGGVVSGGFGREVEGGERC